MNRIIFAFALFLAIGAGNVFSQEMTPAKIARPSSAIALQKGKEARHELLKKRAEAGEFDIAYIGDSITEHWETKPEAQKIWREKLAPLKAQNFGVSGDRTENVLWRVKNEIFLGKSNPKLVVLLIGTNNTKFGDQPQNIAKDIKEIIGAIRKENSRTKILILAILPREEKSDAPMRKNNDTVNALIKDFADDKKVFFADIGKVFLTENGTLEKTVAPDFLHFSGEGYQRYATAIVPEIQKILAKK